MPFFSKKFAMFKKTFSARHLGFLIIIVVLAVGLYGNFLSSPIFFDDLPFFMLNSQGSQPIDSYFYSWNEIRSLPYTTLAWTKKYFGPNLVGFRIGNLILHIATVVAMYALLARVFVASYIPKDGESLTAYDLACIGVVVFALHPVATYAVGYLVQRTILMATLFCVLAMWVCAAAVIEKNNALFWLCVPLYYFAVFSKEHAIMLPCVLASLALYLADNRRNIVSIIWKPMLAMICVALLVVGSKFGMLGTAYEPEADKMLDAAMLPHAYIFSIITQCGLFFKYIWLWCVPNIDSMSIDMREVFAETIFSYRSIFVFIYLSWGMVGASLILKGGGRGLIGLSMFVPWTFYFTELAAVRVQEPFVLYRSYLWAAGAMFALPVLLKNVTKAQACLVVPIVSIFLSILSMERLATLSNQILIWEDAKKLLVGKEQIKGAERIYYNLGRHLLIANMYSESEKNTKKAIEIDENFAQAHGLLGAVYNATQQWDKAIFEYNISRDINASRNEPVSPIYLMGRARAYEGLGNSQLAIRDYFDACGIDIRACDHLKRLEKQHKEN